MSRAKYQVLVIPYYIENKTIRYCLFHRSDMDAWQFIAGGGEDTDANILCSAKREAYEEANIDINNAYMQLDTTSSIPTFCFKDAEKLWGKTCFVIPEYCFGVLITEKRIAISNEHTEYEWCCYDEAVKRLKYDSNRTALWELDNRIRLILGQ